MASSYINLNDIVGKTFNWITVLSYDHEENNNGYAVYYYKCKCICGKIIICLRHSLRGGHKRSCGCMSKVHEGHQARHGMCHTRFYKIWDGMKQRCDNPNDKAYNNYGGRGITYCDEWSKFEGFYEDMYESYCEHVEEYGEKDTTLDRTDNDGNYCKENCTWKTMLEQANNKRNSYKEYDGKKLSSRQIYETYYHHPSITLEQFMCRINNHKWDIYRALNEPLHYSYEYNNQRYSFNELYKLADSNLSESAFRCRIVRSNKYVTSYGLVYNDNLFKLKSYCTKGLKFPIKIIDENRKQEIISETNEQLKSIKFNYTTLH